MLQDQDVADLMDTETDHVKDLKAAVDLVAAAPE